MTTELSPPDKIASHSGSNSESRFVYYRRTREDFPAHARRGRLRRLVGSALAIGLLAGCISGPELRLPLEARQNDRVSIVWLHAYPGKKGVLLLGSVRRPILAVGPLRGHVHIDVEFRDGIEILSTDTRWSGNLSPRGGNRARFAALLRTPHSDKISRISVEYRAASDDLGNR